MTEDKKFEPLGKTGFPWRSIHLVMMDINAVAISLAVTV